MIEFWDCVFSHELPGRDGWFVLEKTAGFPQVSSTTAGSKIEAKVWGKLNW